MATLTAAGSPFQPPGLPLDLLPSVDMTTLTASELRALSLSSSAIYSRSGGDDVAIPNIDHSNFNESAGSRRQTFSRPSPNHHHHRHRLAALQSKTPNPPNPNPTPPSTNDPDRVENQSIIAFLKQYLSSHPDFQQPDYLDLDIFGQFNHNNPINLRFASSPPPPHLETVPVVNGFRKRKRGRKPKVKSVMGGECSLEIVNKNGVAVDLAALGEMEDPYGEELRTRTQRMEKEEELLGFMRDLGGQWCSRRRKRKIVEASVLGDALPVGWKLLLGLKRREGSAWVYCRRYIRYTFDCCSYLHSSYLWLLIKDCTKAKGWGRVCMQNCIDFVH